MIIDDATVERIADRLIELGYTPNKNLACNMARAVLAASGWGELASAPAPAPKNDESEMPYRVLNMDHGGMEVELLRPYVGDVIRFSGTHPALGYVPAPTPDGSTPSTPSTSAQDEGAQDEGAHHEGDGWRTISSAPLAKMVLLWHPAWRHPFPGQCNGDDGACYIDTCEVEAKGWQTYASYWQPLPSPPRETPT